MDTHNVLRNVTDILTENDGSLPDINFDFGGARLVADDYAVVRSHATHLTSGSAHYWSKGKGVDVVFGFEDAPAIEFLAGDAEPFHVVFGGLRSSSGCAVPDIGVFVLDHGFLALDYRMGPEWNEGAVVGLFELMHDLAILSGNVKITHTGNIFDGEGSILLNAYNAWSRARRPTGGG